MLRPNEQNKLLVIMEKSKNPYLRSKYQYAILYLKMMTFRKSLVAAVLTLGILSACGDQKKKEAMEAEAAKIEAQAQAAAEAEAEAAKEAAAKEAAEAEAAEAEKRKLDSLQQVKEHGHVH